MLLPLQAGPAQLIIAALIGIAVLVLLITKFKMHPFLALTIGSLLVGGIGGLPLKQMISSFTKGVGDTVSGVGVLIALGAIIGKLLADSGGADAIVDTIVGKASPKVLPWAMALAGALIGLPMFFEIGLVLLIPVVVLVARRSKLPLMTIGIPTLAGLSAMHAFVPPHPGPLAAAGLLKADLGLTLGLGVLCAIPAVAVAGPLFAKLAARWVPVSAPDTFLGSGADHPAGDEVAKTETVKRPSFGITMATVLLPVVLMMGKSFADMTVASGNPVRHVLDFIGEPLIALLLTTLVALFTLGRGAGMGLEKLGDTVGNSLPPIAGILLIVGAGGGFKQVLVDTGIGKMMADLIIGSPISPLLLAWLVAVLIRLATGSATVATITAAGILGPVAATMGPTELSLLVLAIGAGSIFFSHVNDAGFWLVKEYFGLDVGQTIKSWSLMETVLSVTGVLMVLLLSVFV